MLSNEISNEIQHIDQEIINNNLLPDISLNILNTLKKKIISIYIKYIKNISNKFLTINLHLTIMIIFELCNTCNIQQIRSTTLVHNAQP